MTLYSVRYPVLILLTIEDEIQEEILGVIALHQVDPMLLMS
jgi:hypothetical protein